MTNGADGTTTADDTDLGPLAAWRDDLRAAFAAPVPEHVADQHLARLRDVLAVLHGPRDGIEVIDPG